ncbi:C2H2 finger domain-containing protein [Colletotrichum musicola]|uniref:C2H2 finger domain-containing protein n=1 Tax=Colletotrichum musicola TaxID=2175873 RepID=A0A8H6NYK2_9PEZI|nr:C2H2 finger domain-containing protein [Colletotrichum musicola]
MDSHYYHGSSYYVNATSPVSSGDNSYVVESPTYLEAPALVRQLSDASSRPGEPLTPSSYGSSPGSPGGMSYAYHHTMSHSPADNYGTGGGYYGEDGAYYGDEYASAAAAGSSSAVQQTSESYYGDVDWSKYDYVPTEDGGYWQMKPRFVPAGQYPMVIPHQGGQEQEVVDYKFPCLEAGCTANPFKRKADLERHYRQVHQDPSKKEAHKCDYPKCSRRNEPFGRRDHFRDHLRDYHNEDIFKRGTHVDDSWLQGRNLSSRWWRCSKCLIRVDVNSYPDHVCPKCKNPCEDKRKRARGWH